MNLPATRAQLRLLPFHVSAAHGGMPPPRLLRILGVFWIVDGLLQLQPSMFGPYLVKGVLQPAVQGQPALLAGLLEPAAGFTSSHTALANITIVIVQLCLGLSFLTGRALRLAIPASVAWSFVVWLFGEGAGSLFTGQASLLTGAPGPVLLYAALAIGLLSPPGSKSEVRRKLRSCLAALWMVGALLQSQAFWWQPHQISNAIASVEVPGTVSGALLDSMLGSLASAAYRMEVPLEVALISVFVGLAYVVWQADGPKLRVPLLISIVLSLLIWVSAQGLGLLLTGTSTDPNSGPLLVLLAVGCWPKKDDDTVQASAGRQSQRHHPRLEPYRS